MSELFNKNARRIASIKPIRTHERLGYLGRYNAAGAIDLNVHSGLSEDYSWVRFGDNRGATRVRNLKVRAEWGAPVWVAYNELTREDEVREVHGTLAPQAFGGALAAALNVPHVPASVSTPLAGSDIEDCAVRPELNTAGNISLVVRILAGFTPFRNYQTGATLVTLVPTVTSGRQSFVMVGLDSTNAAVLALTADKIPTFPYFDTNGKLTPQGAAEIETVMDANPTVWWLWSFLLANGTTAVDTQKQKDLRLWNQPQTTSSSAITGDVLPSTCEGRLTLETAVPVSITDQTTKTTLYFTPYSGSVVALYDGVSVWTGYTFTERSLSLAGYTANTNYDVWLYNNAGTPALETTAWTNGTTRATALVAQNGVYVKTGATTRRYLGTIRTTGTTGECEDSVLKRFVWNSQNRLQRMLKIRDATASWTYQSATIRQVRAAVANQVAVVVGLREEALSLLALESNYHLDNSTSGQTFIGENSVTAAHADCIPSYGGYGFSTWTAHLDVIPPLGYTYYAWLEVTSAGVNMTMYGPGSGVDGTIWG